MKRILLAAVMAMVGWMPVQAGGKGPVRDAIPAPNVTRLMTEPATSTPASNPPAAEILPEVVVFLDPGVDPVHFARDHAFIPKRPLVSDPNAWVFEVPTPTTATTPTLLHADATKSGHEPVLEKDARVRAAFPNRRIARTLYGFSPNDEYFHFGTPLPDRLGQWHLINELGTGIDARVVNPWLEGVTGEGVLIGIVDNSLEAAHEDLAANFSAANSWDFLDMDNDPSPTKMGSVDSHGTVVAGVAAARGGNAIGVTGAAPLAGLAGLRLGFNGTSSTDADFADATFLHSWGADTAIKVKNHSYGFTEAWMRVPLEIYTLGISSRAGTIHVFSAGNDRINSSFGTRDTNKNPYQSNPDAIVVSAVGMDGRFKSYSSFGASVFVAAPSGILSTDTTGTQQGFNFGGFPDPDYVDQIEGTSFSAPLVAGVMAMGKQVKPALNVRFAKHLLVKSCDLIDPTDNSEESDGGWKVNGAGNRFNQNYGFGLINATRFIEMARLYPGLTNQRTEQTGLIGVGMAIPDSNPAGVSRTFVFTSTDPLEEVLVTLNITHPFAGDVEAFLTSPANLTSRLFIRSGMGDAADNINWTFCTNAFWGENPAGTWRLVVTDTQPLDTGTFDSFEVTIRMGRLLEIPNAVRNWAYE